MQYLEPAEEGFEGPEKTLNVLFDAEAGVAGAASLRSVTRERWGRTLELARCQILSVMSNEHCDAYVLSESSLFVYDRRVILKTCGTTRLLLALDDITELARERGLRTRSVVYTRKNYTFPARQVYPHTSFADERAFLDERFGGCSTVVGPMTDDHWYFYVADLAREGDAPLASRNECVFEVRMHELHPSAARAFVQNGLRAGVTGPEVTLETGISAIVPGTSIDEHLFEPCGYSMNGLLGPWYSTIHVTPEDHCSYASYETNLPLESYDALLAAVLAVFRPSTYTVHLASPDAAAHALNAPGPAVATTLSAPLSGGVDVRTWNFVAAPDARRERRLVRGAQFCAGVERDVSCVAVTPECACLSETPMSSSPAPPVQFDDRIEVDA